MPVFEYQCKDCSGKYEVFHKSVSSEEEVVCPSCSSTESKKLFSTFSASDERNFILGGGFILCDGKLRCSRSNRRLCVWNVRDIEDFGLTAFADICFSIR